MNQQNRAKNLLLAIGAAVVVFILLMLAMGRMLGGSDNGTVSDYDPPVPTTPAPVASPSTEGIS